MPIISLKQLLDCAAEASCGIPAFNINNIEQVRAIMQAADQTNSPVILQQSAGARAYAGPSFIPHMVKAALEEWPHIPVCLHQDHGASHAVCLRSIQQGFSSVMIDGSLLEDMSTPSDFDYNVTVTQQVVQSAHACGVSVEGELGCLGSLETLRAAKEDGSGAHGQLSQQELLTDPEQAKIFVQKTGVDALAIAIGTSHGAYKFSRPPQADLLDLERIQRIHALLPDTHLVMHGASSVPCDRINLINQYGGNIPETYGVPIADIQKAIAFGIRKVNVDTDLRLAATAGIRQYLAQHPSEFDPRQYLGAAMAGMQDICKERFQAFGCQGLASRIHVQSLARMQLFYQST